MKHGVEVYGGFAGTETSRDERDPNPDTNNTVLSGDLGGGVHSYHVVTILLSREEGETEDRATVLDGFTITEGDASGALDNGGGGVFAWSLVWAARGPTLRNLHLVQNSAVEGGGIYIYFGHARVEHCTFTGNSALSAGAISTGWGAVSVADCAFRGNSAAGSGGAASLGGFSAVTQCTFAGNGCDNGSCAQNAGAVYFSNGVSMELLDCVFFGNASQYRGGAVWAV